MRTTGGYQVDKTFNAKKFYDSSFVVHLKAPLGRTTVILHIKLLRLTRTLMVKCKQLHDALNQPLVS